MYTHINEPEKFESTLPIEPFFIFILPRRIFTNRNILAMRIADQTIQTVKDTADIVEVVQDFVTLRKQGKDYKGLCPFHDEKTPSFYVSPSKGIYKCFGCGQAGDPLKFVMDVEKMGFLDAIRYLANKYHIHIVEEETQEASPEQTLRESILIVLEAANQYYQGCLRNSEEGKSIGLSYFKERGLIDATITAFQLGYSLDQWDGFFKHALTKGYQTDLLDKAGLLSEKDGKYFDKFRGRVMFPILNVSGKVVGFGARTLKKDDHAKYLNSPETEVYHKSEVLYGLYQAKNAIRKLDNCLLTEGYMDVITLHQAGLDHAVASSGTSLTNEQARLIKRFTNHVTLLYDGDKAGIKAALRGVDILLEWGLSVRIVILPDGEDPDSYVKKNGGSRLREFIEKYSQDFVLFKADLFMEESKKDPVKKAALIHDLVETIVKIPDGIQRAVFFKECSELMQVDEDILVAEGNRLLIQRKNKEKDKQNNQQAQPQQFPSEAASDQPESVFIEPEAPKITNPLLWQEREIIRLFIMHGHKEIEKDIAMYEYLLGELHEVEFEHPAHREILELYRRREFGRQAPDHRYFIEKGSPETQTLVVNIIANPHELSPHWEKFNVVVLPLDVSLHESAYKSVLYYKYFKVKILKEECNAMLKSADSDEALNEAMMLFMALKQEENRLAKLLGIVIS